MNEIDMTQFKTEGQPAFPVEDKENDNSSDSSTGEETNSDQTGASDQDNKETEGENGTKDDQNFASHPRWKEREDDWKSRFNEQEERHTSEISKLREELMGKLGPDKTDTPVKIPAWFGGDEQQWAEFQEWNKGLAEQAKKEALKEITSKSEAENKAVAEATEYFNTQVASLESDKTLNPQGEKIDRNKLLKFVLDNDVVDSQGRWNYRAAFQMMKAGATQTKSDNINEKKKLAGATTSENRAETKAPAYKTSNDFSKQGERPW